MDKCQKNAQESSKGTDQGGIDGGGGRGGALNFSEWKKPPIHFKY